ncbi:50S ribosomal protein L21 [Candidatus Uhrbacteria bacterium]|nr:50S ribosomal protein L21 [Candidatus Uhrbacteria bacterium]
MFAIIVSGGKQHVVEEGRWFSTEKIDQEVGTAVEFDALLVSNDEGTATKIGTPNVAGVKVKGKILEHGREKKISVIKYKPKVRYRRNVGHRQPFTKVLIEKITA